MSKIYVKIQDGKDITCVFFNEVDLISITNVDIFIKLQQLIVGFVPDNYFFLDKYGEFVLDTKTLSECDFRDGDFVSIKSRSDFCFCYVSQECWYHYVIPFCENTLDSMISYQPQRILVNCRKKSVEDLVSGSSIMPNQPTRVLENDPLKNSETIMASLFAPSQIRRGNWEKIQVFLYKDSEFEEVVEKARKVDSSSRIKSYNPLDMELRFGDAVEVTLKMYDEGIKIQPHENHIVWQGSYKDCEFLIQVQKESSIESVAGEAEISINGIQIGKLVFNMDVVEKEPLMLNTIIKAKPYRRIFISYSHKDKKKVELIAKTCKAQNLEYFFDRHTLDPGDNFDEKIELWIRSVDLFILCWSKHAAKSEYVKKEYRQAIELSELNKQPRETSLRISPFNINPKAKPPIELAKLHFEDLSEGWFRGLFESILTRLQSPKRKTTTAR